MSQPQFYSNHQAFRKAIQQIENKLQASQAISHNERIALLAHYLNSRQTRKSQKYAHE